MLPMNKFKIIIVFFLFNYAYSQNNFGSWNILNATVNVSEKWTVFGEAQLRSLSFYNQFHYYEVKTGATYKLNKNFSFTTGFGSYNTFSEGGNFETPMRNKEIRTWLQINNKNQLEYFVIDHRYRAEQRFATNGYRNRFRYRVVATVPLNNKKLIPKTYYIQAWNELFFTDKQPYFERNRLFLGGGYEFSKNFTFQAGYIHQFDYKINDETGRDFLNIAFLYSFDVKKEMERNDTHLTND